MGKSARQRQQRSSSAETGGSGVSGGSVDMRRPKTMKRPAAYNRSCKASNVLLGLLAALGVALLTVFVFTLRPLGYSVFRNNLVDVEPTLSGDEENEIGGVAGNSAVEKNESLHVYTYEVIEEYDHDPHAFTQGLTYAGNGNLYESTGLRGQSSVREVDLRTGKVLKKYEMDPRLFGEGLTIWKNRLLQVIWREKRVLIYDKETLQPDGELSHRMKDGWGLTASREHIIGSDGTPKLYFMNPENFEEVRNMTVMDGDKEVGYLNELEYVNDEIWANIWQGGCIARISPQDGKVVGWILLHALRKELISKGVKGMDVLNGIAWDHDEDKLYVTGKFWPKLYEIKLLDSVHITNESLQAVRKLCNIGKPEGFQ